MGPIWLRAKIWSRMPPALSATSAPTTVKPIAKPIHLNTECLTVSVGTVSAAEMAPLVACAPKCRKSTAIGVAIGGCSDGDGSGAAVTGGSMTVICATNRYPIPVTVSIYLGVSESSRSR